LEGFKKAVRGDIGQDIGVHHPERVFIEEPADMGKHAAGSEDFRFERNLDPDAGSGVEAQVIEDESGVIVSVD
jgi:hypothetical protein